jgi:hypothetical protein
MPNWNEVAKQRRLERKGKPSMLPLYVCLVVGGSLMAIGFLWSMGVV